MDVDLRSLREALGISLRDDFEGDPHWKPWGKRAGVKVADRGHWRLIHAEECEAGTDCDETTDSLSGDPWENRETWDWIGPVETMPAEPTRENLDAWAVVTCHGSGSSIDSQAFCYAGRKVSTLRWDGKVAIEEWIRDERNTVTLELPAEKLPSVRSRGDIVGDGELTSRIAYTCANAIYDAVETWRPRGDKRLIIVGDPVDPDGHLRCRVWLPHGALDEDAAAERLEYLQAIGDGALLALSPRLSCRVTRTEAGPDLLVEMLAVLK